MHFTTLIKLLFFLLPVASFSQITENGVQNSALNTGSIENQFETIISKSTNWSDTYGAPNKVIKLSLLNDLKSQVLDSLQAAQKKIMATERTVTGQKQEISDLNAKIALTQQTLAITKNQGQDLSFLGLSIDKTLYHTILWSIIAVLLVVLILLFYQFKNNNELTKNAKVALADLENEYEEHRKTNIEREQKLRRELLNEINKQKITQAKK